MYTWLKNDLTNTTEKWTIVIWHHPAYSKGSHDSDSESYMVEMRQYFMPLIDSFSVDAVFSGHSHSYERSYYINGHYGNSSTFDSTQHTVGLDGGRSGRLAESGAYIRDLTTPSAKRGLVYLTAGSSGQKSGGSLNHKAMFMSLNQLGSCILEINVDRMDIKFLRENNTIEDSLTILKCDKNVLYVDPQATGNASGTSWSNAFTNLTTALSYPCMAAVDTIYLAQGIYIPTTANRDSSFILPANKLIKGGFQTGGNVHDPALYPTMISGNIGSAASTTDNLYAVLKVINGRSNVTLSDVTITGGNADGGGDKSRGSAIKCDGILTLNRVIITGNKSSLIDGIFDSKSNSKIIIRNDCSIYGNN